MRSTTVWLIPVASPISRSEWPAARAIAIAWSRSAVAFTTAWASRLRCTASSVSTHGTVAGRGGAGVPLAMWSAIQFGSTSVAVFVVMFGIVPLIDHLSMVERYDSKRQTGPCSEVSVAHMMATKAVPLYWATPSASPDALVLRNMSPGPIGPCRSSCCRPGAARPSRRTRRCCTCRCPPSPSRHSARCRRGPGRWRRSATRRTSRWCRTRRCRAYARWCRPCGRVAW